MSTPSSRSSRTAVVLVEDDPTIGRSLEQGLSSHGYPTAWCRTGSAALLAVREHPPDVLLIDLSLPDVDGADLVRTLRPQHPHLLMIMLAGAETDPDLLLGPDADDYLTKPFSLGVLLALLRAHRRVRPEDTTERGDIQVGALRVNLGSRRCWLEDREVVLRPREFDLLAVLIVRAGRAVNRQDLVAEAWKEHRVGSIKSLDVTMAALRRKLGSAGRDPAGHDEAGVDQAGRDLAGQDEAGRPRFTTLRGYGYRLEQPGR